MRPPLTPHQERENKVILAIKGFAEQPSSLAGEGMGEW